MLASFNITTYHKQKQGLRKMRITYIFIVAQFRNSEKGIHGLCALFPIWPYNKQIFLELNARILHTALQVEVP